MDEQRLAELRAAWVTEPPRHDAPIVLAEPDPAWPATYDALAARIRGALGSRALLLEHAGSTSIPGLPAKPVIDGVLVVADPADEPAWLPDLAAAGFRLAIREPGWHEHRLVKAADIASNIHVLPPGCIEVRRMLAFRDHLRRDADDRARYLARKRELAARTWDYVQGYADAKGEVVEEILVRALAAPPGTRRSARLAFDPIADADAPALHAALDHPDVGTWIGGPDVTTVAALRERIAFLHAGPRPGGSDRAWLNHVVRMGGTVIGRAESTLHDGWAELAWVLDPRAWGRGYGTEVATWLAGHLAAEHATGDLWATVAPGNVRSERLAARAGFLPESPPFRRDPGSYDDGDLVFSLRIPIVPCACGGVVPTSGEGG